MIDSCPRPTGTAHSLGICLNTERPGGTENLRLGVLLPPLYVHLAKRVILRKLVGGETEIGSFIEVVVTWEIIYRISGK